MTYTLPVVQILWPFVHTFSNNRLLNWEIFCHTFQQTRIWNTAAVKSGAVHTATETRHPVTSLKDIKHLPARDEVIHKASLLPLTADFIVPFENNTRQLTWRSLTPTFHWRHTCDTFVAKFERYSYKTNPHILKEQKNICFEISTFSGQELITCSAGMQIVCGQEGIFRARFANATKNGARFRGQETNYE